MEQPRSRAGGLVKAGGASGVADSSAIEGNGVGFHEREWGAIVYFSGSLA
jgi:hypothetical protein